MICPMPHPRSGSVTLSALRIIDPYTLLRPIRRDGGKSEGTTFIYADGELVQNSTSKNFLLVRQEGKRQVQRNIVHYNLDVIIALTYLATAPYNGGGFRHSRWSLTVHR